MRVARRWATALWAMLVWHMVAGCAMDETFSWITPQAAPQTVVFHGDIGRGETFAYPIAALCVSAQTSCVFSHCARPTALVNLLSAR